MDTSRTCPRCGNALQPTDKFCKNCGMAVDAPPTQSLNASEAEAARASYQPPPGPGYQPPPAGPQGYQPPAASGPGYQPPPGPGYQPPPGGSQTYQPAGATGPTYQPPSPGYQPPPGGPTYTPPPAAAPAKRPRWLFAAIGCLGLVIIGCIAFFAITFFAASNLTQPMTNAGESFLTAVRDGNYPAAFALCTPALQQELGDAQQFASSMQDIKLTKWDFSSRRIENNTGYLEGTATLSGGKQASLQLALDQVNGDWKVSGYNIQEK